MAYDAFISYSHTGDGLLAPRLQQSLQRFAKPWWRRRSLRVFHDESTLSANPGLWSSITDALDESEWFVLLASPDAAQSEWVNREVEYWCTHKDPAHVLPVVTEGEWAWDGAAGGFDMALCTAVPLALVGVFHEEPRHIDMRWARSDAQLDLQNGRFRDQVGSSPHQCTAWRRTTSPATTCGNTGGCCAPPGVRSPCCCCCWPPPSRVHSSPCGLRTRPPRASRRPSTRESRPIARRPSPSRASGTQQRKDEADVSGPGKRAANGTRRTGTRSRPTGNGRSPINAANAEAARRAADSANEQPHRPVDELGDERRARSVQRQPRDHERRPRDGQRRPRPVQPATRRHQPGPRVVEPTTGVDQRTAECRQQHAHRAGRQPRRGPPRRAGRRRVRAPTRRGAAVGGRRRTAHAATDGRIPNTTLFDLVANRGLGLDRVLQFNRGTTGCRSPSARTRRIAGRSRSTMCSRRRRSPCGRRTLRQELEPAPSGSRWPTSCPPTRRSGQQAVTSSCARSCRSRSSTPTHRCHRRKSVSRSSTSRRAHGVLSFAPTVEAVVARAPTRRCGPRCRPAFKDERRIANRRLHADRRPHRLDREPAPRSCFVAARRRRHGIARRRDGPRLLRGR